MIRPITAVVLLLLATGCRESVTAPAAPRATLEVLGAAEIHAAVGKLPVPLEVTARDAASGKLMKNVDVDWSVTAGNATLDGSRSATDEFGVARITLTISTLGASTVRASTARQNGTAPEFTLHGVDRGEISSIAPITIVPGAEMVIDGRNFSETAARNVVLFDGVRGTVIDASSSRLTVRVPACLPSREIEVRAGIGYAVSTGTPVFTSGTNLGAIRLEPAEIHTLDSASDLACLQLSHEPNALYMFITQNSETTVAPPRSFRLHTLGAAPPVAIVAAAAADQPFALAWESALRQSEREFPAGPAIEPLSIRAAATEVGDPRQFSVINSSSQFDRIDATARVVTERAVIYVDNEAADAFDEQSLQQLGRLFDDPIFATVTRTFGTPSDIDGNGRVMMLFTPRVNAMTPRASSSFVAGFFYGCDLLSRNRCSGSNGGELFYSMVPDPRGVWSDSRSVQTVMNAVPSVLAHEFQHMIHFARRGFNSEVLWLAEGMAHTAEELVGDALKAKGDPRSTLFYQGNYSRARLYLADIDDVSLITEDSPGTIEMRGGAWLFLKYLRGHFGGDQLLGRLTATTRSSVANITAEVPRAWDDLITDFAVALWVSGTTAADRMGAYQQFADFNPRTVLVGSTQFYPLRPGIRPWMDLNVPITLPSSSMHYLVVSAETGTSGALNAVLTRADGAPIDGERVRLSVLRLR